MWLNPSQKADPPKREQALTGYKERNSTNRVNPACVLVSMCHAMNHNMARQDDSMIIAQTRIRQPQQKKHKVPETHTLFQT